MHSSINESIADNTGTHNVRDVLSHLPPEEGLTVITLLTTQTFVRTRAASSSTGTVLAVIPLQRIKYWYLKN